MHLHSKLRNLGARFVLRFYFCPRCKFSEIGKWLCVIFCLPSFEEKNSTMRKQWGSEFLGLFVNRKFDYSCGFSSSAQ